MSDHLPTDPLSIGSGSGTKSASQKPEGTPISADPDRARESLGNYPRVEGEFDHGPREEGAKKNADKEKAKDSDNTNSANTPNQEHSNYSDPWSTESIVKALESVFNSRNSPVTALIKTPFTGVMGTAGAIYGGIIGVREYCLGNKDTAQESFANAGYIFKKGWTGPMEQWAEESVYAQQKRGQKKMTEKDNDEQKVEQNKAEQDNKSQKADNSTDRAQETKRENNNACNEEPLQIYTTSTYARGVTEEEEKMFEQSDSGSRLSSNNGELITPQVDSTRELSVDVSGSAPTGSELRALNETPETRQDPNAQPKQTNTPNSQRPSI